MSRGDFNRPLFEEFAKNAYKITKKLALTIDKC